MTLPLRKDRRPRRPPGQRQGWRVVDDLLGSRSAPRFVVVPVS